MYCTLCGRSHLDDEWSCPSCGGCIFGSALDGSVRPEAESSTLRGVLSQIAVLPRHGSMLLYGPPAGGKSTLALCAFQRPAVITTEMSAGQLVSYGHRLGVYVAKAAPPELEKWPSETEDGIPVWKWPYEPDAPDGLILDSVNGAENPAAFLRFGIAEARRRRLPLIAIAQVTVDGSVRGGTSLPHLVDVVVHVGPSNGQSMARCEKCRFGAPSSALFRLGGSAAVKPGYYVVTGRAPNFRLEPWPWATCDVFELADAGKLDVPEPPVAAAARNTRLLGWVEPPDVAERKAFAERSGVPYFSPSLRSV